MPAAADTQRYAEHKQREAKRSRKKSQEGRDIGDLPPIIDVARRQGCEFNLRLFCETYLKEQFSLAWSKAHLLALAKLERAILKGGLFALAMPRGSGKTTLAEAAAMWAILYGHIRFVVIVGAESDHAEEIAESMRVEIESNELLYEDFPEVCYPIECLDGIVNRSAGQLQNGERTRIKWTGRIIKLPTIEGSQSSGGVVKTAGITGRIRGMRVKLADGSTLRPGLILVDDPQTDESAKSITQNASRLKVLSKAILGLKGPTGKPIAAVMACTVIEPGDCIDQILDVQKYPQWQGQRTKLIEAWPTSKRWETYAELWKVGMQEGRGIEDATAYYREYRAEMQEGAIVNWPERFDEGELDAIQHCWNLRLTLGIKAFLAEYNNDPQPDVETKQLDFFMAARQGAFTQWEIPAWAIKSTAFIDVQGEALFYLCTSWAQDFTGAIVNYGIYPEQRIGLARLSELSDLLSDKEGAGLEGRMSEALLNTIGMLRSKAKFDAIGIDANWGLSTDAVYKIAYEQAANNVHAMHGRFYGASSAPLNGGRPKQGEQRGYYWKRIIEGPRTRILFDNNAWKDTLLSRLQTSLGDSGALSVFSPAADNHSLLDEHFHAEHYVEVWARGIKRNEWKQTPGVDNHWWDCLVGAGVLANFVGCSVPTWSSDRPRQVSFAEMQRQARAG
jgi:hypothetical protein